MIRPRRDLVSAAFTLPPIALVVLALALAFEGGGVPTSQWIPCSVAAGVSLGTLALVGAMPAIPRQAVPVLLALAALVALSGISIIWSDLPDETLLATARTGLAGIGLVVGAIYASRPRTALALVVAVVIAGTVIALLSVGHLLAGDLDALRAGRLAWPVSYANGAAAVAFIAVPAAVVLAAAVPLRPSFRAAAGAAAALMTGVGLAAESRAGTAALLVAVAVATVLARPRSRAALHLPAVFAPGGLVLPFLIAGETPSVGDERRLAVVILVASLLAGGGTLAAAMLQRRSRWPFGDGEGRRAAALWGIVLAVGLIGLIFHVRNPISWTSARWSDFQAVGKIRGQVPDRFGTIQGNRYDYYRVALVAAQSHPLGGVGAGAYAAVWYRDRAVDENIDDAHSWEIGALAELGVPGVVLLGIVLLLPFRGVRRARMSEDAWPIAGAALAGTGAYFVFHASADWLLRIPSVSLTGMLALGALAGVSGGGAPVLASLRARAAVGVASLAVVAVGLPSYLAQRSLDRAERQAITSPASAIASLAEAARIDPFAVRPLALRAQLQLAYGSPAEAYATAVDATRRAPDDWTAWVVRARAGAVAGRADAADDRARAIALNPIGAPRALDFPGVHP